MHHIDTVKFDFSDHNARLVTVQTMDTAGHEKTISMIDYEALAEIVGMYIREVSDLNGNSSQKYDALANLLTQANAASTKTKKIKHKRFKLCEWLHRSPDVLRLINQKRNLWRNQK